MTQWYNFLTNIHLKKPLLETRQKFVSKNKTYSVSEKIRPLCHIYIVSNRMRKIHADIYLFIYLFIIVFWEELLLYRGYGPSPSMVHVRPWDRGT